MEIIIKYYDINGKLRIAKDKNKAVNQKISFVRFKVLKNSEWPCCDFHGKCTNKAYAEVYPSLMKKGKKGWSYLCRKHYYEEQKRFNWKMPACLSIEW